MIEGNATRGGMTLEQCAVELGLTREGVRRLEAKALEKCAIWCRVRGLELHELIDAKPPGDDDETLYPIFPKCPRKKSL